MKESILWISGGKIFRGINFKIRFFRSKSTGRFVNASTLCLSDHSVFYNTVLSHGDGSIKNYPIRREVPDAELCKSQDQSNLNILWILCASNTMREKYIVISW